MKHVDSTISNLALLFTDLEGSTEFYSRVGDEAGFRAVQEHFKLLAEVVKRHNGTLVKTMGDAIMATFAEPVNALKAALEIQRRNSGFLRIRIGLHYGPCYSIGNAGHADHYGNTVNLAARLQAISQGGEIVLTDAMVRDSKVALLLGAHAGQVKRFQAILKGIENRLELVRIEARKVPIPAVIEVSESAPTLTEYPAFSVKSEKGETSGGLLSQGKIQVWFRGVMGRCLVLLAALVLSSCLRVTQSHPSGSLNAGLGSYAGTDIALSGNGEAYGGDYHPPILSGVERSPGFKCGSTVLGYSSRLFSPQDGTVVLSTDPCDSATDTVFPTSQDYIAALGPDDSLVSRKFFSIQGRIYEGSDPTTGEFPNTNDTYRTEAWCHPELYLGRAFDRTEVTIEYHPSTGERTATVYLVWGDDPFTHQPLGKFYVWAGQTTPFPVSRTDSGPSSSYTTRDFSLSIATALILGDPLHHAGHLRLTLSGLESEFDLVCVRPGK